MIGSISQRGHLKCRPLIDNYTSKHMLMVLASKRPAVVLYFYLSIEFNCAVVPNMKTPLHSARGIREQMKKKVSRIFFNTQWPPKSSNENLLDFYAWIIFKSKVDTKNIKKKKNIKFIELPQGHLWIPCDGFTGRFKTIIPAKCGQF